MKNDSSKQTIHVFTSSAFNYIPKARMLFESFRKHHPDYKLHVALPDLVNPDFDIKKEPFDSLLPISELGIPNWKPWSFGHQIVELATAIKPFALQHLLARDDTKAVYYFDPDMVAFSKLDDLNTLLDTSNLILTPHQLKPEQSLAAIMDNEISSLKHGIYNLGFVGVKPTPTGKAFAAWWGERCYHFCRDAIPNGLFTDQRWIDLAPAFFEDVGVVRSSRHNVAPWNITTREVSGSMKKGFTVDGAPLGFYHFTGFDSGDHTIMLDVNAKGNQSVKELAKWYHNETVNLRSDPLSKAPWAFANYADGTPIKIAERRVYRERVDLQRAFKDPYDPAGYLQWFKTQGPAEFPGLFSKSETERAAALAEIVGPLTPGYRGEDAKIDWQKVRSTILGNPRDSRTMSDKIKRGIDIAKKEGSKGLKNKFIR